MAEMEYVNRLDMAFSTFICLIQMLADIQNSSFIATTLQRMDDSHTHDIDYYDPDIGFSTDGGATHISVMTTTGSAVALTSSINEV